MSWTEYLALGLEGWTAIGIGGLTMSMVRHERKKLVEGALALVGVWTVYMTILMVFSYLQPERHIARGVPVCFHTVCYAVRQAEVIPAGPQETRKLVRVTIAIENHGRGSASDNVRMYLRDAQGRRWMPSPGVSGVSLNAEIAGHGSATSPQVFAIATDATGLVMVPTHGRWSRYTLVIGNPGSLGHRPQVMELGL